MSTINTEKYDDGPPEDAETIIAQYSPRECQIIIMQYYAVHKMRQNFKISDATFSKFLNRVGIAENRGCNLKKYLISNGDKQIKSILFKDTGNKVDENNIRGCGGLLLY